MSPQNHARLRTARRVALRVALVILALVVVGIGTALAALHTPWGREKLRAQLEAVMDDSFAGDVRIGGLSGSVLGDLVLYDVVIDDLEGRPAIRVARLTVDVGILPLARKEVRFYQTTVAGLIVDGRPLRDGRLNLSALMEKKEEKGAWNLVLDDLDVPGAQISIVPAQGEPVHLAPLDIVDGKLGSYTSGRTELDVAVTGFWHERGLMVSLGAQLQSDAEQTRIPHLDVAVGALEVAARDVVIAGREVRGEATVTAPATTVAMLVKDSPLRGDVELHVAATPGREPRTTAIAVDGKVGSAVFDGDFDLAAEARRLTGRLAARHVDAERIVRGGPDTMVDATITVDGGLDDGRAGLIALRGTATLEASGDVSGAHARSASVAVDLADGHAKARARVRGNGGLDARLDAAIGLAREVGDPIVIDEAHLVARADDLKQASGRLTPASGSLDLDLTARGRVGGTAKPVLAIAGEVHGKDFAYQGRSVRAVDAEVDLRGLPRQADGFAHVAAVDIRSEGRSLGNLELNARSRPDHAIAVEVHSEPPRKPWLVDVDALVRMGDEVRVDLGGHHIHTAGVEWHGRGGTIIVDDHAVHVARLRTTIAKGRLAIDGTVEFGGRRAGDFATSIHLDGVDLAEIDRSLDRGGQWQGRLDTHVHVIKRGTRWYGAVDGEGRGVRLQPDAPPIDVGGIVKLQPGRVRIDARVAGAGIGAISADIDLAAPRRIEDATAWQRLDRAAIQRGKIVLDRLDLAELARVTGSEVQVAGRVDGTITLTATESNGTITARDVTTPKIQAPLDVDLTIDQIEKTAVAIRLTAVLRDIATAKAQALVAIPARPFDPGAWARLGTDDLRGASIRVDDLVLDAERSRKLGLGEAWYGKGKLEATIAPGLRDAQLTIDVTDVRGGVIVQPVAAHLDGDIDQDGAHAILTGSAGGRELITGEVRVPLGLAELRDGGAAQLRDTAVDGTITIRRSSVRTLTATLGRSDDIVGTIDGTVTIAGTVATPTAKAIVTLREIGFRRPTLRQLEVRAGWDAGVVTVAARGAQHDGGKLALDGRADTAALDRATARLTAKGFDLAPLAQLGPPEVLGVRGILDARVDVAGVDPATAQVNGFLHLKEGNMPLGPQLGTMRDAKIDVGLERGALTAGVDGKVGNGTIHVKSRGTLQGLMPRTLSTEVTADGITLIGDVEPRIAGVARATLRRTGDTWRIDGEVRHGTVVIPERDEVKLHAAGMPDDMVIIENGRPPPRAIEPEAAWQSLLGQRPTHPTLIAAIKIRRIRVHSKELRGIVRGDLTLTAGDDGVALDGELHASQGSVALFDRRYRIDRGRVVFDGGVDPNLDVALIHDFPQLTLYINVRGRVSQPDLELSSRPATYTEGQLLSFLMGGSPGRDPGTEVRDAATGVASSLLSQKVGGAVGNYLPVQVDVLRYDAATASSSASFTVGKWFTRRLFVAYQRRVEARPDQNAGEAQLEYWLAPDVMVEAKAGDRGHHDADLLWIRRW